MLTDGTEKYDKLMDSVDRFKDKFLELYEDENIFDMIDNLSDVSSFSELDFPKFNCLDLADEYSFMSDKCDARIDNQSSVELESSCDTHKKLNVPMKTYKNDSAGGSSNVGRNISKSNNENTMDFSSCVKAPEMPNPLSYNPNVIECRNILLPDLTRFKYATFCIYSGDDFPATISNVRSTYVKFQFDNNMPTYTTSVWYNSACPAKYNTGYVLDIAGCDIQNAQPSISVFDLINNDTHELIGSNVIPLHTGTEYSDAFVICKSKWIDIYKPGSRRFTGRILVTLILHENENPPIELPKQVPEDILPLKHVEIKEKEVSVNTKDNIKECLQESSDIPTYQKVDHESKVNTNETPHKYQDYPDNINQSEKDCCTTSSEETFKESHDPSLSVVQNECKVERMLEDDKNANREVLNIDDIDDGGLSEYIDFNFKRFSLFDRIKMQRKSLKSGKSIGSVPPKVVFVDENYLCDTDDDDIPTQETGYKSIQISPISYGGVNWIDKNKDNTYRADKSLPIPHHNIGINVSTILQPIIYKKVVVKQSEEIDDNLIEDQMNKRSEKEYEISALGKSCQNWNFAKIEKYTSYSDYGFYSRKSTLQ